MKKAMEKLDLMVIVDPYPTHAAVMNDRKEGTYLLPALDQFETYGSVTASNRSIQWRDQVVDPCGSRSPITPSWRSSRASSASRTSCSGNVQVNATTDEPNVEDITREINKGMWTIGYTGQSPERLRLHAEHRKTFDTTSLRAEGGPADGDFYGMPWPSWGNPDTEFTYVNTKGETVTKKGHPGTPVLYNPSMRWATVASPSGRVSASNANGVKPARRGCPQHELGISRTAIPSSTTRCSSSSGGGTTSPRRRRRRPKGRTGRPTSRAASSGWAINHGCAPFGNAKARAVVWTFPDPVPIHREPLFSPHRDLVEKYPTYEDRKRFYRLPTRYASYQAEDHSKSFPLIFSSGRLVEYEGGGEEQRSTSWLAELQQDMFVEINPKDANDRGLKDGQTVWLETPTEGTATIKAKAMVTRRVAPGVVWTPFHFGGFFQGEDLVAKYPEGTAPYVRGDACNTAMTYGYDSVTQMQETKVSPVSESALPEQEETYDGSNEVFSVTPSAASSATAASSRARTSTRCPGA